MTIEEFQTSVKNVCQGKEYDDLPSSFKQWIVAMFNTIDTDGKESILRKIFSSDGKYLQVTVSSDWRSTVTTVSTDKLSQTSKI